MAALSGTSYLSATPPSAYRTADEGVSSPAAQDTDMSSPCERGLGKIANKTSYRRAKDLPYELRYRCQIHLEEQTYAAGLDLLNSLLCDAISSPTALTKPALVPPPAQLAMLATLSIQPKHTSLLSNSAEHDVATMSLSFLRSVLSLVGPVNGRLRDAFLFHSHSKRHRRGSDDPPRDGSESEDEPIYGKTANSGSIWARGQNFWRVLGWAFNCSALYPHRWRWWRPWLDFMLDVLELDYDERRRLDLERMAKGERADHPLLWDSLLLCYITPPNTRSSPLRPIMNALFADGAVSSSTMYEEVFEKESRVKSKICGNRRKRRKLDLDNDDFGDYMKDSSSDGSEPPTPSHRATSADIGDESVSWTSSSLGETVRMRVRLFALLSRAAEDAPDRCRFKMADLYGEFAHRIGQLPVPAFARFVAPHDPVLDPRSLVAIIRLLMPALLPSSTPQPYHVHPEVDEQESISDRILEKCYLPFAYRTAANNAKLSLAVEALFRMLWQGGVLRWTQGLQQAVETGVQARRDKSAPRKNSRRQDGERAAREMLHASEARILALTHFLKAQAMHSA